MRWIVVFLVMGRLSWMMMMEVGDGMELGIWRSVGWLDGSICGCIYKSIYVNSTLGLSASFRWLSSHNSLYPCKLEESRQPKKGSAHMKYMRST